jgi:tetratricopeptide (TPR) repeat protein
MRGEYILFFVIFSFISCEPTQDFKGEIIPEQKLISALLSSEKDQNQKSISYLNQLIEEGSPIHWYYLRAQYLFESRQYKKANIDIQHALKFSPSESDYLFLAGQIALNLENYKVALHYLNLIKGDKIKHFPVLFLLAEVSVKLNQFSLATYYLNQIKINDLSSIDRLYYTVLRYLSSINKLPNLLNSLDQKSMQDVRIQRFYFENANGINSKFLYQNQLLEFINKYPNDPHLLRFWARFLSQIKQFKMAEIAYLKVVKLFEPNEALYFEIGSFYMRNRNYIQALLYFDKIKSDLESFTDVPFLKSKCYLYLGDRNRYQLTMDSVQTIFKNDVRFYQLKRKYFGISMDSNLVAKDSLLTM